MVDDLINDCHLNCNDMIVLEPRVLYFLCHPQSTMPKFCDCIKEHKSFEEKLQEVSSISAQIELVYENERLKEGEERLRHLLCYNLEKSLFNLFSMCRIYPVGSTTNGLAKFDCDLDMFLVCGKTQMKELFLMKHQQINNNEFLRADFMLKHIRNIIDNSLPCCSKVFYIRGAKTPIVTFEHSGVECDLSICNNDSVWKTALLHTFGEIDERVKPLIFIIHKWAASNGLLSKKKGSMITKFILTEMVIFFLQNCQPVILPSIIELLKYTGSISLDGFETIPDEILSKNLDTLEDLLYGFFHFYEVFDFKTMGISLMNKNTFHKPNSCPLYIQDLYNFEVNCSNNVNFMEYIRFHKFLRASRQMLENRQSNWNITKLFNLIVENEKDPVINFHMRSLFENSSNRDTKKLMKKVRVVDNALNPSVLCGSSSISVEDDLSVLK